MSAPSKFIDFLKSQFKAAIPTDASETDLPNLSPHIYPHSSYSDSEKAEISQWLMTSFRLAVPDEDGLLPPLNIHLSTRTTLLGSKPSVADIALFYNLGPNVRKWSPELRTGEKGYHHIVRHIDFVQNAPAMGLSLSEEEKVKIDVDDVQHVIKPIDPKEEKERKKKEKAAATTASANPTDKTKVGGETALPVGRSKPSNLQPTTQESEAATAAPAAPSAANPSTTKKEKKEKQPKQPKAQPPAKAAPAPLSPSLIDLRIGHILRAVQHPNADSLYVSTMDCGDAPGTENTSIDEATGKTVRTVCSGLNGLVPLDDMQGRRVVAVCNLKPVTMRGIKSAAMVLAGSPKLAEGEEDSHKGPVELVEVPSDAAAGDRVGFHGWAGEPEGVLNPKKKVWETLQPGFTTDKEGRVGFDVGVVEALKGEGSGDGKEGGLSLLETKSGGVCKVKSLTGAVVR